MKRFRLHRRLPDLIHILYVFFVDGPVGIVAGPSVRFAVVPTARPGRTIETAPARQRNVEPFSAVLGRPVLVVRSRRGRAFPGEPPVASLAVRRRLVAHAPVLAQDRRAARVESVVQDEDGRGPRAPVPSRCSPHYDLTTLPCVCPSPSPSAPLPPAPTSKTPNQDLLDRLPTSDDLAKHD